MPHVCYFSYHPWIAASEGQSLTTQEHQHPYPILLEFYHSSPSLFKNREQPEVDKNILACKTLTLTESFVFSLCRCSKQSVSHVVTLNWSEHFIWWAFKFVVETIIHCYCMFVKSFIWETRVWLHHMFRSRGILLKFNVLCSLHNTISRLNWMSAFLKQSWSNTRSTLWETWENNLETF